MKKKSTGEQAVAIMQAIQNLEEIGGPDSLQEYIEILESVKTNIDWRIKNAKERLKAGEE